MYLLRLWKRLFDTLQKNYGWFVKIKLKCLAIYNFVFPSLNSPPTNKDTIVFMAIKMLEIQKLLEAVAI